MQRTLDLGAAEAAAGFRLQRFEVLNWGTFDRRIWSLVPAGQNSLLTGDIGSGKSTLVDGLTTLLVAPQQIVYNKAAGADTRERSLHSYIRGYYKSEKDADSLSAKAVALRGDQSYSALLAQFCNAGLRQAATLAQVFWQRDHNDPPVRFYVVAAKALTLAEAFTDFGGDPLALKKRLGKTPGVKVFDSYARYAVEFQRRMGIENPRALNLFYQTVSMKSVGNLTDFVRRHMLESPPVQERIDTLCRNFDDLNRAHEAVLRARRQVDALAPIVEEAGRYRGIEAAVAGLKSLREALHAYFASLKIHLLDGRIAQRRQAIERLEAQLAACRGQIDALETRRRDLERAIADSGGRRLEALSAEIERLDRQRQQIADKARRYEKICRELKLPLPRDEAAFVDTRRRVAEAKEQLGRKRTELINARVEQGVALKALEERMAVLEAEIRSLEGRRSNIPSANLDLRRALCRALDIDEDALPFAGELIQVRAAEARWTGAIERLVHSFGLSLLVSEEHYGTVAAYVDATHLASRLVYFKTGEAGADAGAAAGTDTPAGKLEIKPDTPFYDWIEREIAARFRHVCCERLEDFRRLPNALTAGGQIKTGGRRHEKDDRFRIDDPGRYVLGWRNRQKIEALKAELARLAAEAEACRGQVRAIQQRMARNDLGLERLQDLLGYETFAEIDWQSVAVRITDLEAERRSIEESSDVLAALRAKRDETAAELAVLDGRREKMLAHRGKLDEGLRQDSRQHEAAVAVLAGLPEAERPQRFAALAAMQPEALPETRLTVDNCDASQTRMRDWLQDRIDAETERGKRSAERVTRGMQQYKGLYPAETREVDASVEAIDAFAEMLATLRREDLPRHEQRFKTMLNEGTIQNMALFQAKLDQELHEIRGKIDTINRSLAAIDFNEGTMIQLVTDPSRDVEIRQFREDLRACLGDTLAGGRDEAYTEHKFLQVKAVIDRFNGRAGHADLDKRWTAKVTDVRQWLIFSVSERWREDGKEKEFYSDTAGKSGGQKEKLAYTILAAALAYQFGLNRGEARSRSFRFVMIDEAFGRGSDDSTRYALELFQRLDLQLLIVTPLQKINVIEDYVAAVHFIHNENGKNSMVRNLTIEQYREEKAAFAEAGAA